MHWAEMCEVHRPQGQLQTAQIATERTPEWDVISFMIVIAHFQTDINKGSFTLVHQFYYTEVHKAAVSMVY